MTRRPRHPRSEALFSTHASTGPRRLAQHAAAAALLLLGACSGGGGSDAPPPNQAPVAAFEAAPEVGDAPLTVAFDATGSGDGDGAITRYAWSFGDGGTGSGATVTHTYDEAGSFDARLTVTDDDGATDTAAVTIEAVAPQPAGFVVSGTIRAQAASVTDSDTNDVNAVTRSNDDFDTAQIVPNPATVGGYVAVPGAGEPGAVQPTGDPADLYRLTALGGETVLLSIGNVEAADLDLRLYDANRQLVDSSLGIDTTESLLVPSGGTWFVEVVPFSGASNYVLNIGELETTGASRALRLSDAFVPGEILLPASSGPNATGPNATATAPPAAASAEPLPAFEVVGGERGGPRLARLARQPADRDVVGLAAGAVPTSAAQDVRLRTLLSIKRMRASERWRWVAPNYVRRSQATPDDEFFPNQWHYRAIKLPQAWEVTTGDADVVVAVVDTGILPEHPELRDKLIDGFDFVSDPANAGDGDGIDPDPSEELDTGTDVTPFHGSHVAGTVAADTANGIGVAGVGWKTRIMPLRALGIGGSGSTFDVVQAVRYAAGLPNDSGTVPSRPADIVNLSLGGGGFTQQEADLYAELRRRGIFVTAAAGNDSAPRVDYPAAYAAVTAVSATAIGNELAFYSNTGPEVDVAAPGGDTSTDVDGDGFGDGVLSTIGDDSQNPPAAALGYLAGTSMAAPHVAGVMALMKAVAPSLTPDQFDTLLASGVLTEDLGAQGRDAEFGFGLINAQKAVVAALEVAGDPDDIGPILVANPSSLSFGAITESLRFRLSNAGGGEARVQRPVVDASWLTVEATDAGPDGLGFYQLRVDRAGLADGVYRTAVRFPSDANDVLLTVRMQVSSIDLAADAGFHYVLLVPEGGDEATFQDTVRPADGLYDFRFDNVAPGRYELLAGTDSDNDLLICDDAEACGFFRTYDSPTPIEIEGDTPGLEFVTGFRSSILTPAAAGAAGTQSAPEARRRSRRPE